MLSMTADEPGRALRGALLGCGSIAPYHLRAWAQIEGVEIVALANRTVSKAEALAEEFAIPLGQVYGDYRQLLKHERLDFVDIATAPHVHREQVLAAAAHGVHVLCQKPLATSLDEALAMIRACETTGVRCVVNENWRWRRWYRELRHMLDQGVVGTPRYARFHSHTDTVLPRPHGGLPPLLTTQAYTAHMPHLILLEWGIHLVDVLRFLFGDVASVHARMERLSPLVRGEDLAVITLVFRSGVIGLVDISWAAHMPEERRLQRGNLDALLVEGDAGTIELDPYPGDLFIVTRPVGSERRPARGGLTPAEAYQESYVNAQRHFVHCLRTGQPAENEARDNLKTLAVVFAAYDSAAQDEVVFLQNETAP